jgi:hypothetical protein
MPNSTLDVTGEESPVTTLGHGTGALGPSDSSDSGSDVVGGPGMDEGLTDDQARQMPRHVRGTSGRDLGDPLLESDSDRAGTGERGAAGVESDGPNDTATTLHPGIESAEDEFDDPGAVEIERVDSDVRNLETDASELDDTSVSDGAT